MPQPTVLLAALLLLVPLATASDPSAAWDVHTSWPAGAAAEPVVASSAAVAAPLLRLLALHQQQQREQQQQPELRLTLALPTGRSVEVGEGTTLEGLVAALLEEKTGLRPSSLELVSVQQQRVVTEGRIAHTWAALLRSLAARVQRMCPPTWRISGLAAEDDGMLPAAPTTVADDAAQQQAWEAALAASSAEAQAAGQRRRRLKSLESAVEELLAEAAPLEVSRGPPQRLFGPPRTPSELVAARRAADVAPGAAASQAFTLTVELVSTERRSVVRHPWATLFGGSSSGSAGAEQALGLQLLAGDDDGLAELLALVPLDQPGSYVQHQQLGRKAALGGAGGAASAAAAAGDSLARFLASFDAEGLSQQAVTAHLPSHYRHRGHLAEPVLAYRPVLHPYALAAVDLVFVVASAVGLVCAALLLADACRRRRRRGAAAAGRGCSGSGSYPAGALVGGSEAADKQRQLLTPLIVVAAEEAAVHDAARA